MSKNDVKKSRCVQFTCVVFALIVLGSMLSNFNIYDFFYLFAITVFVIRYFIAIKIKK